ncbi:MAG: endonuclease MutS2 [Bacilli bacterium]
MNKHYKTLELDKIIDIITGFIRLDINKEEIYNVSLKSDLDEIKEELERVDQTSIIIQRMGSFPLLFHIDISYILLKAFKSGVLDTNELVKINNLLDTVRDFYLYTEKLDNAEIDYSSLLAVINDLSYNKDLNLQIKNIVNPYGEIKDTASPMLASIRKKQKDLEKNIQNKLQEVLNKNNSILTQSVVSLRNGRYVIPVRADSKNLIKGIIHDQSASRETVFIEPAIINDLNNSLNQNIQDEKDEIYNILRNISAIIGSYFDELTSNYEIIKKLDLIYAKASYAISINASKPNINKNGILELINCRHPLLNVDNVVSNSISMGKDYKGIVITGPNTGGKTVLLKTVGLLSLMVKFGLLIPADDTSNVMIFDDVYADIGDEQSINQNLSTFSSHLKNVIDIMNHVNNNSLVLLDELGSGTDPLEGAGLAIGIFDFLINKKCLIIATSHYSELKIHAYNSKEIINASVEFDEVTLKPTYKLLIGVPGMSNALKIGKNLGLSDEIIKNAENYLFKRNDNLNQMLDKLVKQSRELDIKLKDIDLKKNELLLKEIELERQKEINLKEEEQIITKANEKSRKLIESSMERINDLLEELKSNKDKGLKVHEIADLTHKVRKLETDNHINIDNRRSDNISENDTVFVKSFNCYGLVTKELKNNKFEVLIGNATMKIDKKELVLSESKTTTSPKKSVDVSIKTKVTSELDLRGKRYDEASNMIDKFIDEAIYANLNTISIIHGFGTGTIRRLVLDTLKNHKEIAEFRFGGANEGGQGVTIATLKK